jgi:hypothetical protein
LRGELLRIAGVDSTQIDGLDVQTPQTMTSDAGVDMSRWNSERQFRYHKQRLQWVATLGAAFNMQLIPMKRVAS